MKILVIQTAFTGDVILATPILEKLHSIYPDAAIDFLLRKGNETLFSGHPYLHETLVWDKRHRKIFNLFKIIRRVRKAKYDIAINVHRFASSGAVMWLSAARQKMGFDKNPFSFCYTYTVNHTISNGKHECERNLELISTLLPIAPSPKDFLPRLYPQPNDFEYVREFAVSPYLCIAPASVWFTKQFPARKWIELIDDLNGKYRVHLIGAEADVPLCASIRNGVRQPDNVVNLAGKLSFLQSAALMKKTEMNFVNDSAPLHLASAVNAPVNAVFCSTVPSFGFGPLSDKSFITETQEILDCRPCGLHGYKRCPQKHFKCAETISVQALVNNLKESN